MPEGDAKSKLFMGVGECLHSWSWVELELSNLYMMLHSIKRDEFSHPTRAAFEIIISLDVRTAMIQAYVAADISIRGNYLPHFTLLKARILKLYKKRHQVAHFMVVARQNKSEMQSLIRPFFTENAFRQQKGAELNADQIAKRAQTFYILAARIRRHIQHVGMLRDLPPEYYVQAGDIAFPPLGTEDLIPEE